VPRSVKIWFGLVAALAIGYYFLAASKGDCIGPHSPIRIKIANADINGSIKTALGNYKADTGQYPKSLQDLFTQPTNVANWHGPYLDNLPLDPWQNAYIYRFPGEHDTNGYDLLSAGPDGKEGTSDDIGNWMK
jgi:general secretion pathway protein G